MRLLDIRSRFNNFKGHKMGRVFVQFGKTISLKEYFASTKTGAFTAEHVNESALQLTKDLVLQHHLASPVFLSMVIASLLLQLEEDTYPLKDLVRDCERLYHYFKLRGVNMVMTQKPNKKAIEKVLGGLNYDVKNQKRAASKLAEPHILLGKKKNQREQMSLYYY